jgi:hypothetical protein
MSARRPEMGAEMTARKPALSKPNPAATALPERRSFRAGARRLLRGLILASILWAIFAQPLLGPHCSWSEFAGYCYPGDDGGCAWDDSAGTCW